jgi:hypothetical protein
MPSRRVGPESRVSNNYSTLFSGTENPLSEGGVWTNGSFGTNWTDIQKGAAATGANGAFGTQTPHATPPFDDSIAVLKGFSRDQSSSLVISRGTVANDVELEMHLRSQIAPGFIRGYEIDLYTPTTKLSIVRWNGPINDFTFLVDNIFTNVTMNDGDVWFAQMIGTVIVIKCNGTIVQTYDTANDAFIWGRGNPGIGAYRDTSLGAPSAANTFCWDSGTFASLASDQWQFVSAASSKTKTVTKNVTAGSLLTVGFVCGDSTSTPTISDGINTWLPVSVSPVKDTTNGNSVSMWSTVAKTTGSITVTITAAPTTFNGTWIKEWTGNAPSNVNAGSAGTANIAGTLVKNGIQTGAFTPSVPGCLIETFIVDAGNVDTARQFNAGTSPSVFTKEDTASQDPAGATDATYAVADFVQGAAVSINPTWTQANSRASLGISAAFAPGGASIAWIRG